MPRNAELALRAMAVVALGAVTVAGLLAAAGTAVLLWAGSIDADIFFIPDEVELGDLAQRSVIYAADGTELAVLHDEVDRRTVPLAEIPEHVRQAVLVAEDRRFYEHRGYDVAGIGRALLANLRAGGVAQGGSTITQQLAKTNVVGAERSLQRKLDELRYAIALERDHTKDELLERYLNQVYFGSGAYGIAAAAEEFFRVDPVDLDIHQAALLAGLIRSPGGLDPRTNAEGARGVRDTVLAGMADEGVLDPAEAEAARARPVEVAPPLERTSDDPYVVEAVKRAFFDDPAFGATRQDRVNLLLTGGLEVHTTIDPGLQRAAEDIIAAHLADAEGPTAAIATVDPRNGHVLAVASGADFADEQYDLAMQGRRQPGSAFKPFVLAAALEDGFGLQDRFSGTSPTYFDVQGWTREDGGVRNFGDASLGEVDLRTAMVRSVNTAFAELILEVGHVRVAGLADAMGIDTGAALGPGDGPAIALGGLGQGVTALEMASAYGVFGHAGHHVEPVLVARVVDRSGREVTPDPQVRRALSPEVNAAMVDVLRDVVRRGTGAAAALPGWDVAGKTGTTQQSADAWFVATTPVRATAVWVGHPEGQVPMRGMTGGGVPARIWRAFAEVAHAGLGPTPFPDADVDFSNLLDGDRQPTIERTGTPAPPTSAEPEPSDEPTPESTDEPTPEVTPGLPDAVEPETVTAVPAEG
jgi:penicillin-binding protein 1A